jgi:NAD-dependent dihydropyrimidine dehydrogenase PreA subunit
MAYVIAEPCINVKDRACVEVCPVDCIHPRAEEDKGEPQLYINPDECIDCGACEPVCPVKAIFPEDEVPGEWKDYVAINADYYRVDREQFAERWHQKA